MLKPSKKSLLKKWSPEELKVLDTCQHIHKYAEELYQDLAEIHHENREIARIWGLLAIDKCNHSDTFKMAARLKGEGISEINISVELVGNVLTKMKTLPKVDKRNPPSVLNALRFTVKMEENLVDVHFSRVVKFFSKQDTVLMASSLKSSSSILHLMTEEYLNLTILESEVFE